jgi:transcriptional regulator with XRE-family HTH domain
LQVLSDVVGDQVRRLREGAGLTREDLAERCGTISAAALSNLETGRRDPAGRRRREVTVDEVFLLAYALDVPPVALLLPIGHKDASDGVRLAGGMPLRTADALAWVRGDRRPWPGAEPTIYAMVRLYVKAAESVQELVALIGEWTPDDRSFGIPGGSLGIPSEPIAQARPPGWHERFETVLAHVRDYREHLRTLGHPCPVLPMGMSWVDPKDQKEAPSED